MIENNYVVYLHERLDKPGHIFYCGSGRPKRPYDKNDRNYYWHNIVDKHGYKTHIIASGLTKEESLCTEGFVTFEYKDIGMCKACFDIPINGVNYESKPHSEETRKKMSESAKDKPKSEEHRNNISKSLSGRPKSKEHIQSISEYHADMSGENNPMYGKQHSEEAKEKNRLSHLGMFVGKKHPRARKVTNGIICFYTAKEAAEFYGKSKWAISSCIKMKCKCAGFNWEYIKENNEA